jgi:hypothetical protein
MAFRFESIAGALATRPAGAWLAIAGLAVAVASALASIVLVGPASLICLAIAASAFLPAAVWLARIYSGAPDAPQATPDKPSATKARLFDLLVFAVVCTTGALLSLGLGEPLWQAGELAISSLACVVWAFFVWRKLRVDAASPGDALYGGGMSARKLAGVILAVAAVAGWWAMAYQNFTSHWHKRPDMVALQVVNGLVFAFAILRGAWRSDPQPLEWGKRRALSFTEPES